MAGPDTKLEYAYIAVLEPPPQSKKPPKLSDVMQGKSGEPITFQFNPKEYTVKKSAKWERKAGKNNKKAALPEFMGPEPRTLDVELFFDKPTAENGVQDDVEKLFDCLSPTDKTRVAGKPSAPWVLFGWGAKGQLVGVIKSVSAKYTLFRPSGVPIRAVCTVSIEEMPTEPPKLNPTSGALDVYRSHQVVEGESLASVAYEEYDDARLWRALAEVNGIDNPFRVHPGRTLRVPSLAEASHHA